MTIDRDMGFHGSEDDGMEDDDDEDDDNEVFTMTNEIYLGVHDDEDNGMEDDCKLSKHVGQDCGGQGKTLK